MTQPSAAAAADPANAKSYWSYEGLPVNLKGLEVLLKYDSSPKDNKVITLDSGDAKFYTEPTYAVGFLSNDNTKNYWNPMTNYILLVQVGGKPFYAEVKIPGVVPIARAESWTNLEANIGNGYEYIDNPELYWSQGLQLVGSLTEKLYVDDFPSLGQYKLQARWSDGTDDNIPLGPETNWTIRPRYDNGLDRTGKGDLLITVGKNTVKYNDKRITDSSIITGTVVGGVDLTGDNKADPGLTAVKMYEEVWHVRGIELVEEPTLDPFFYWQADDTPAWVARLIAANARIKVTYTNDRTKEFSVQEATWMNDVWYNEAPEWKTISTPFGVKGVYASSLPTSSYPKGLPHSRNKDPKITLNYRGGVTTIKVPVYTKLVSIIATPKTGEGIDVDMKKRDNDVGGMNATAFAALVEVKATFSSAIDSNDTKEVTLSFDENLFHDDDTIAVSAGNRESYNQGVPIMWNFDDPSDPSYVSNVNTYPTTPTKSAFPAGTTQEALATAYSMNFGKPSYPDTLTPGLVVDGWNPNYTPDPTNSALNAKGIRLPKWAGMSDYSVQAFGVCDQTTNNNKTKAVIFYYAPPYEDPSLPSADQIWGVTTGSAKRYSLAQVNWTNIHSK